MKVFGSPVLRPGYGEGDYIIDGLRFSLPKDLIDALLASIRSRAYVVKLDGTHHSSRHQIPSGGLVSIVAVGVDLVADCPWLFELYNNELLGLVQEYDGIGKTNPDEKALAIKATDYLSSVDALNAAIRADVLFPGMSLETHIDVWPIGLNLYLQGTGRLSTDTDDELLTSEGQGLSIVRVTHTPHGIDPIGGISLPPQYEPDFRDEMNWRGARITINFSFGTPAFFRLLQTGQAIQLPHPYVLGLETSRSSYGEAINPSSNQSGSQLDGPHI